MSSISGAILPFSCIESEQGDDIREDIDVVTVLGNVGSVGDDHALATNGAKRIDPEIVRIRATLNTEYLRLAILRLTLVRAGGGIAVEEAVKTCTVYEDVLAVKDAKTEGITVSSEAVRVSWIIES